MGIDEIKIAGLKEFVKATKQVDRELGKAFTGAHKEIATLMAKRSQAAMKAAGGQAAKAAKAAKPKATQYAAILRNIANPPYALGVIWGAKARFGWYRALRYDLPDAPKQFKPWVGNQYEPGANEGKPYFVGDAVNRSIDEAMQIIGDSFEEIARKAFPD